MDRLIQQAISQILTPIYEEQFSDNSYGFRPKKSAHDALKKCQANISEGYVYVVDVDLEKYFDTVKQAHSNPVGNDKGWKSDFPHTQIPACRDYGRRIV